MPKLSVIRSAANDYFPYDPCAICNLLLDEGAGTTPTLQALQVLLYFTHGMFLIRTKRPLIFGHFEAWPSGPVNPASQMAFQPAGKQPISFRALDEDLLERKVFRHEFPTDEVVRDCVRRVTAAFGTMTEAQLLSIARAAEGPWDATANKPGTSVVIGMRISDNMILERFKFHKIVL